ncbi:MAG: ATP-binding protein [Bacteroidetes bacterium]|nr:ATP-binding protein [Bacteroidota bacterium]
MYIPRIIFDDIIKHLPKKEFTIITGARQTGKTTILKQLFNTIKKQNKEVFYLTLEKEEVLQEINNNPENIFQYTGKIANPLYEDVSETIYLLLDEIQYADNPSNFLKYLYDTYSPNLKIIATGSSSFYIDKKFKDSLVGRKRLFHLKTLNFDEFLVFKDKIDLKHELEKTRERQEYKSVRYAEIMHYLSEYLTFGGYPNVVLAQSDEEKINVLEEIKNSYIKRDILDSKVENRQAFYNLLNILAGQTGNLLNKNMLSKSLRIDLSTVENYLYILQKNFHIELVKPFFRNIKKELIKMPKVYFNDIGLLNIFLNRFQVFVKREDKGSLLENYVYIRLREIYRQDDIKFWRTASGNEVDFVVSETFGKGKAFEVKYNANLLIKSKYKLFRNTYPDYPLKIIQFDFSTEPVITPVLKLQ